MWSDLMYFLPIAAMFSRCEINDSITLDGDLGEELTKLIRTYFNTDRLEFKVSPSLHARVNASYPAGTNLWTIFHGLMERFHLTVELTGSDDGIVKVLLKEGVAWMR